jgi:hypothetical protein
VRAGLTNKDALHNMLHYSNEATRQQNPSKDHGMAIIATL